MPDQINPSLVLAHARAWIGTPFLRRAALRGVGADCIGLIRGVYHELTGRAVAAPPWRADWATGPDEPIMAGLFEHSLRMPLADAAPGHVITYRVGRERAAHVAILADDGIIHCWEVGGVKETQHLFGREITSAWALPCAPGYERGPDTLTAEDCLAVIYRDGRGYHAEITETLTGASLALTPSYETQAAALAALDPIYPNIETVE